MACIKPKASVTDPGCMKVSVTRLAAEGLKAVVSRLGDSLDAFVQRVAGQELAVSVSRLASEGLKVRCGLVCSVAEVRYLNVSPEEVQWITDDIGVFYNIESNTDWIVVTS